MTKNSNPGGGGGRLPQTDFQDSCIGYGGPDWVIPIFANPNTNHTAIGSDRRFDQTALPSVILMKAAQSDRNADLNLLL